MQQVLTDPIVFVITMITLTTIGLIGASVLGLDYGVVLKSMGTTEFARGLITYLFAITTIGVAVSVILYALTQSGTGTDPKDIRFDRRPIIAAWRIWNHRGFLFWSASDTEKGGD